MDRATNYLQRRLRSKQIIAYLYLPRNAHPLFQTVIYFPGSAPWYVKSSTNADHYFEFPLLLSFILKNGRAVLFPVYKEAFERGNMGLAQLNEVRTSTYQYSQNAIQAVKDFRRCLYYLQTRRDIDSQKLVYYGMSWGGVFGAMIPATEDRLKVSVPTSGGMAGWGRPKANAASCGSHVKIPTLMLNGRYDTLLPPQIAQKPMFDLLGTPTPDKQWKLYDTNRIPP